MIARRALIVILAALSFGLATPAGAAPAQEAQPPGKVLLVAAPALRWLDLVDHDLPNLERFLGEASVAKLSMRTLGARTGIGAGYATIGAGNRTGASAAIAGLALEPRERFEEGRAADAFRRRTGTEPVGELLHLGFPSIARVNAGYLYGSVPGALAEVLGESGYRTGLVANGDLGIGLAEEPPDLTAVNAPAAEVATGDEEETGIDEQGIPMQDPDVEEPADVDEVVDDHDDEEAPDPRPLHEGERGRAAALAAVDETGQVHRARADGLLRRDPTAPYGVRYDIGAVVDAFESVWGDVDLAVVELSDLDRADAYRRQARGAAAAELWAEALVRSDELFGQLLDHVEPGTTVILTTPAPPRAGETLGVFAMSDGASPTQILQSGTTRRPGYVTLPDIAPTIVEHFGVDKPTSMTGAPIGGTAELTVDHALFESFAGATAQAIHRDRVMGAVSVTFVVVQILAYALAAVALARRRRWTVPVSFLALVVLAVPPVAFLAGVLDLERGSAAVYQLGLFGSALVLAAAAEGIGRLVGRRVHRASGMLAPLFLVGLTWSVLVIDVLTGGSLQINTVFGYSPLVAGRFAGFGNLALSLVAAGTVVLACGAWGVYRLASAPVDGTAAMRARPAVVFGAFLGLTAIIIGAPMWGQNVGGFLSTASGFAVMLLVAMRVPITVARGVLIGAGTTVTIGALALLDLTRPADDRTHLGRLVSRTIEDPATFGEVLERKLNANIHILTSSVWTLTIPFALGLLVYLARRRTGLLRDLQEEVPGIRPLLAGGLLVAFLGFALNDSGVAIPAMMFAVLLPFLTYVLLRWEPAQR